MNEKKRAKWMVFFLGIFLMVISIFLEMLQYYRIIFTVLGIICLLFASMYLRKDKLKFLPIYLLFYLFVSILVDSAAVTLFNTLPVYSYNILTSGNSSVYNAIGYRVWDCEGKERKVDRFYKLGYYCDVNDMEAIDSNVFLSHVVENYEDYKNNYIKIVGKISKKEGNSYIEMQAYQENAITLNGYATFSDAVTLRVLFKGENENLNYHDVYDTIAVVGKVWYIRNTDGKYVVYMDDGVVVDEESFDSYNMIIRSSATCGVDKKLLYAGADYNFYSHCLDSAIVKFDESQIYELSGVLSSGKLKISDILANANERIYDEVTKSTMFLYDGYTIIQCSENTGSDIIIGDQNLSFEDAYCGIFPEDLQ